MAIKPRSQTAAAAEQKHTPSPAEIERLAKELVDKPYGQHAQAKADTKMPEAEKAKPVAISLPPALIERLQDQAMANKRSGAELKTVSAIVRDALEKAGY
jgi:hypothetical protein